MYCSAKLLPLSAHIPWPRIGKLFFEVENEVIKVRCSGCMLALVAWYGAVMNKILNIERKKLHNKPFSLFALCLCLGNRKGGKGFDKISLIKHLNSEEFI
jgi:hypothetical protein